MDERGENGGVEVRHDEKTESDSDNAEQLDAVIGTDAVGDVVGDFLVKDDTSAAGDEN